MKRTITTTLTVCVLALAAGCEDAFDVPTAPDFPEQPEIWNDAQVSVIERMAKSLAEALADPEFRESLYEEAAEEYTGDTEALYVRLASKQVGGTTWENRLNVDARPEETKRLHFYVYGIEYSSPGEAPLVAVAADNEDVAVLKAFDAQGNEHRINARVAPARALVVVGMNERIDENGVPKEFIPVRRGKLAADAPGGGGGRGGGGGGSTTPTEYEYRSSPHHEHIDSIRIHHTHEPFWKGDPEVKMQMNVVAQPEVKEYKGHFRHVDKKRKWYRVNRGLFFWNSDVHGPAAAVQWLEEDSGVEIEISVPYTIPVLDTVVTFKFKARDGDDDMGSVLVNFDDPLGVFYHTGDVEWNHK